MLLTGVASAQYLALVAGRTIPCVWNVFTAGLLQTHIFTVRMLLANGLHARPACTVRVLLPQSYMRVNLTVRPCVWPQHCNQCQCCLLDQVSDAVVLLAAGYEHSGDIDFVKGAVPAAYRTCQFAHGSVTWPASVSRA